MFWKRLSQSEIRSAVDEALGKNLRYAAPHHETDVLGFPGSFLDREVFPDGAFLADKPFLRCLRENPNHIGCHTLTASETAFSGTQRLEIELVRLCAEEIAGAPPGGCDGYVASGGTECNIQAVWVQRNALRQELGARNEEIAILCSEDTHYSVYKASDLLGLEAIVVPVDDATRRMQPSVLREVVAAAKARGRRHFVCILNMGTTMFGSVDDIDEVCGVLDELGVGYRVHVDAAFGGFLYPFTHPANRLDFRDPRVVSMTMDAHKMLQAPYGTGIYLARKGMMQFVCNEHAAYVHGKDYTLCGSRSGANAVAVWMILMAHGSEGGSVFLRELVARTDRLCAGLDRLSVSYFREPHMNVVAMRAKDVPRAVAERFTLVPDTHEGEPRWWKAVVMDHVDDGAIDRFLHALGPA
ncbi:MAG: pyridoxal phosphate-dependent decarboxylase family protein [Polyangiales bacterium]